MITATVPEPSAELLQAIRQECDRRGISLRYALRAPIFAALAHLGEHPRDAAGARMIMHDGYCQSDCQGAHAVEHAKRHADIVAAFRVALRQVAA